MRLQLAQMFVLAAREFDADLELREDYSGRGMHGEKTAAIVFEGGESDMLRLGAFLGANFKSLVRQVNEHFRKGEDAVPMGWTVEDMFEDLSDMRFDSMGRYGRVAY